MLGDKNIFGLKGSGEKKKKSTISHLVSKMHSGEVSADAYLLLFFLRLTTILKTEY